MGKGNAFRLTEEQLADLLKKRGVAAAPNLGRGMAAVLATPAPAAKPSKYRNTKCVVDGIRFDSIKESERYEVLKEARKTGNVLWFILQPCFRLPGGTRYYADFLVVWRNGSVVIEDVKSGITRKLAVYRTKKREVEHLYGITIHEI